MEFCLLGSSKPACNVLSAHSVMKNDLAEPFAEMGAWRAALGISEGYFRLSAFNSRANVDAAMERIKGL